MTTAQVFADYLGLTPENAPWAFGRNIFCMKCNAYVGRASSPYCKNCKAVGYVEERPHLTATSPLAPEPTPGWLEVMVRHKHGVLYWGERSCHAAYEGHPLSEQFHPTHAVALALIKSNPALRSACERAGDYNEKES